MSGDSKAVTLFTLLLRPAGFGRNHFDNVPQAACFPRERFVIRTVVRILHGGEIQRAGRSDEIEQIVHWIAICAMSEFIGETLNRECVVDVGHRSQPANPDMSVRRTILDAYGR